MITLINDPRFAPAGALAPKSKGRPGLHHAHAALAVRTGQRDCRVSGVLYRGAAENAHLIEKNLVHAVIQLPPGLFFGTTIATCIIVLKKARWRPLRGCLAECT